MGDAGGFLRHCSGGSGGCGRREHSLVWNQETGEEEVLQVELLPGARFRIPAEPGASAWWGEISWLPDHPGGPQVFSLELSALRSQRPEPQ